MSTPTTNPIDIPLMLGRLVPLAEYHWKGSGFGLYSDIGEWRTPEIPKPSEAEVYAEWDIYLVEKAQHDAALAQRIADFGDLIQNKAPGAITAINNELADIDSDLTALAAASTLAAVKPIVQNMLNRQKTTNQRVLAMVKAWLRVADFIS